MSEVIANAREILFPRGKKRPCCSQKDLEASSGQRCAIHLDDLCGRVVPLVSNEWLYVGCRRWFCPVSPMIGKRDIRLMSQNMQNGRFDGEYRCSGVRSLKAVSQEEESQGQEGSVRLLASAPVAHYHPTSEGNGYHCSEGT